MTVRFPVDTPLGQVEVEAFVRNFSRPPQVSDIENVSILIDESHLDAARELAWPHILEQLAREERNDA